MLVDQGALDRRERRVQEKPDLMTIRRCTVEHPFGTIKRMSGGGRFLTRGLRRVKAEAALSVLAFNIIRASNAFGTGALMSRRSEEHTSELQSLMRISYAVFCLKKKNNISKNITTISYV